MTSESHILDTSASSRVAIVLADLRGDLTKQPIKIFLAVLYEDLLPGVTVPPEFKTLVNHSLAKCMQHMPNNQILCLEISKQASTTTIEKIFILVAALKQMRGDCEWLNYNLALELNMLVNQGTSEAGPPRLLHTSAMLLAADKHSPGLPIMKKLMATHELPYMPRNAIIHAAEAVRSGESSALIILQQAALNLNLFDPNDKIESHRKHINRIEKSCGIQTTDTFEFTTASDAGIQGELIVEPSVIVMPSPHGDKFYHIFRKAEQKIHLPSIEAYAINQGTVSFDLTKMGRTQIYVFDKNNKYLEDFSSGMSPFIEPDSDYCTGDLAVIGDKFCGPMNVCHFLLDHFSRIAVYEKFAPGAKILLSEPYDQYISILQKAGLSNRVVMPQKKRFSIRADRVLALSNIARDFRHPGHCAAPWAINYIRERLCPEARAPYRRLFISRADAKTRHILNEIEVEFILSKYNFEITNLSALDLNEQIKLFSEADIVVGVHGAGLTNTVFSPKGTKILEILPPMVATPAYWFLANGCGHSYRTLVADDPEFSRPDYSTWEHHPEFNDRNIVINTDQLELALKALLCDVF